MDFDVRSAVKEHYGEIASKVLKGSKKASCCSCSSSCSSSSSSCKGDMMETSVLYTGADLSSLPKEAVDASLGCANPLVFAELKEGETVLDLGSGGGIDVLMASRYVGKSGKIYGLDMTDEMLELAKKNKEKMGVINVEFLKGYIEDIPLSEKSVDVIMSNCVINLSEDKEKALSEAFRVLKQGGRLAIADIITLKTVPDHLMKLAELWSGCLAGAMEITEYKSTLEKVGFTSVEIDPIHIYTKSMIEREFSEYKDLLEKVSASDIETLDGVFAGALIKAKK